MNRVSTTAAGLLVILFALSPMTFAANAEQAIEKCKTQAESEEIADEDLKTWLSGCLKDEGISTEDTKALIDEEFSNEDQQNAKASTAE